MPRARRNRNNRNINYRIDNRLVRVVRPDQNNLEPPERIQRLDRPHPVRLVAGLGRSNLNHMPQLIGRNKSTQMQFKQKLVSTCVATLTGNLYNPPIPQDEASKNVIFTFSMELYSMLQNRNGWVDLSWKTQTLPALFYELSVDLVFNIKHL